MANLDVNLIITKAGALTNGDVADALAGYEGFSAKSTLKNQFSGLQNAFGFDIAKVATVRDVLDGVLESARKNYSEGKESSKLDLFRQQLIFCAAAATRNDPVRLIIGLYGAVIERHQQVDPRDPAYSDRQDPSAAGQYVLRCMAVQAAYNNFANYAFVVSIFARMVQAIHDTKKKPGDIYDNLLKACVSDSPDPFA